MRQGGTDAHHQSRDGDAGLSNHPGKILITGIMIPDESLRKITSRTNGKQQTKMRIKKKD
jgi:hypothetical protein